MRKISTLLIIFICSGIVQSYGQRGTIKGKIIDIENNKPVPFANIVVQGTSIGVSSDTSGNFVLNGLNPGFTNIVVSSIGYKTEYYRDIQVTNAKSVTIEVKLTPSNREIGAVVIESSPFNKTEESPLSIRTIGIAEIERNPGGNRDISNVLRSFPGVASTPAFRNDIIIRGGSPNENRFYLDGIEVPLINHFQTQGASGGPVGIINVNLIREVNFLSGSFPAARGNALSSVIEFNQVDGSSDRKKYRIALGSSDLGIKAEGPLWKNSTGIFSFRASYLQFLFSALKLPFLPTFFDWQGKIKHKFDDKNELTVIGLASLDFNKLNTADSSTQEQKLILRVIPFNYQQSYTIGAIYKHYTRYGSHSIVLSRNYLDNRATKYQDNDDSNPAKKILDFSSIESENKFRYEYTARRKGWKYTLGVNAEHGYFTNSTFNRVNTVAGLDTFNVRTKLNVFNGGLFGQVSKGLWNERLVLTAGLRTDVSSYNAHMFNPLNQIAPRFGLSLKIVDKLLFNASVGRYYQRPQYLLMGYGDSSGTLLNQNNGLKFIRADHYVAGFEFNPGMNSKITVEGFYKIYTQYPFNLRDSISIANQGAGFGVVGNVAATSISKGRAYGIEFLAQQKLFKGFYGILAYTYVISEFQGKSDRYIPSSWDNRHLLTITSGYKFPQPKTQKKGLKGLLSDWELGVRWRYIGGFPLTPIDTATSLIKQVYDVTGTAIFDEDKLNSERSKAFHQLDMRIDKTWFFKKATLNLYIDIQNVYGFQFFGTPLLDIQRDATGSPLTDPNKPNSYLPVFVNNPTGTRIPTLGIIVDF